MKKLTLLLSIFLFPLSSVYANTNLRQEIRNQLKQQVEIQVEKGATISPSGFIKQLRNEIKNEIREKNQGVFDQIKNQIKEKLNLNAKIEGVIESIENNSLMIKNNKGDSYKVEITDNTKLIRRFGAKSSLNEFRSGDQVIVFGKYTSDDKKTVEARLVRNLSIQKRWGVFFGEVISQSDTSFVIKTINRGELTVYFNNQTKFLSHDKQSISFKDLKVNDRVRIKGVWDKDLKELREVDEVRVFPKPSITPKITIIQEK